jgi:hypothetical protein
MKSDLQSILINCVFIPPFSAAKHSSTPTQPFMSFVNDRDFEVGMYRLAQRNRKI